MAKKLIIFDADSMIFTVAWKFRDKKVKSMVSMHLNSFISEVIAAAGATHYIGFFGSKEDGAKPNFRFDVDPGYKATRPETPEWILKWRPLLHETMTSKWGFVGVDGMEADDAVSIAAKYFKNEFDEIIVAACDKDLKQIPGVTFYNYQKHTSEFISEFNGAFNLAIQLLTGDQTDCVKGLDGIGPKKAEKLLGECTTIAQLKWAVARMYKAKEDELRKKASSETAESIREELETSGAINAATMTDKQIERVLRIECAKRLNSFSDPSMPGGWKAYLKVQSKLLTLLTDVPDGFVLPTPVESKIVPVAAQDELSSEEPDVTTEEFVGVTPATKAPLDNFMYL